MGKNKNYIKMPSWYYPRYIANWNIKYIIFFTVIFIIPWIPSRFTYTEEIYIGPLGLPLFVWGMIAINVLAIAGLFVFYFEAKRRGFFKEDYDMKNDNPGNGGVNI